MQPALDAEPASGRTIELRHARPFDACRLWVVAVSEESLPEVCWVVEPQPVLVAAAAA